jgi:GGDEF domain-containing protein
MLPVKGDAVTRRNVQRRAQSGSTDVNDPRYQAFEDRIHQLVHYDTLTGLPNLEYVDELVGDAIGSASARITGFTVVLVNLDDFRLVDEAFGRAIGDELLRNITRTLTY